MWRWLPTRRAKWTPPISASWRRITSCSWQWRPCSSAPLRSGTESPPHGHELKGLARNRADGAVQDFVSRAVLGLEVVALSVGALQFVFAPASVDRPLLAALGLVCIAASML